MADIDEFHEKIQLCIDKAETSKYKLKRRIELAATNNRGYLSRDGSWEAVYNSEFERIKQSMRGNARLIVEKFFGEVFDKTVSLIEEALMSLRIAHNLSY